MVMAEGLYFFMVEQLTKQNQLWLPNILVHITPDSSFFPIFASPCTVVDLVSSPTKLAIAVLLSHPLLSKSPLYASAVGTFALFLVDSCLLVQPPTPLSHHATWRRLKSSFYWPHSINVPTTEVSGKKTATNSSLQL
ncbi:hypothetical protein SLEP1_g42426 [Rubroshorea leprosula]|uniref:Uncharacterized protein n=1 Tax=Rubroshorea leprosula TaxID=152421 RepID=A0AAV5L9V2_9ROSI|nr:hypothetical protein SLEP1_g42426 [Rubroshorea leprosula]